MMRAYPGSGDSQIAVSMPAAEVVASEAAIFSIAFESVSGGRVKQPVLDVCAVDTEVNSGN